jgi:CHAT domain-containing protein
LKTGYHLIELNDPAGTTPMHEVMHMRRQRPWMALAGAGFLVVIPLLLVWPRLHGQRSPRDVLLSASLDRPPGEGRLAGFPHAPPSRGDFSAAADWADIVRRLDQASAEDPEALASRGALKLLQGETEDAIRLLTRAVDRSGGTDARWWNDLAVSELAAAETDPRHLVLSLAAANRAIENAPELLEAHFNRAMALERLTLHRAARAAWGHYLDLDSSSPWADEARFWYEREEAVSEKAFWESQRGAVHEAAAQGDQQRVEVIVLQAPQLARLFAEEEVLGDWARAATAGDETAAATALRVARAIGQALARSGGDHMLSESVAVIERQESGTTGRRRLAQGHLAYREAMEQIGANQYEAAGDALERARDALSEAGSPFAAWARFQLALRDYRSMQEQAHGRARAELAILEALAAERGYKSLRGRAAWLSGTLLIYQSLPSESLAAYQRSLAAFQEIRETAYTGSVQAMLARNLEFLGDVEGAWRFRAEALRNAALAGDLTRQATILGEASWAVLDMESPSAALDFQDEAVQLIGGMSNPAALAAALRQRAAVFQRQGNRVRALEDLAAAEVQALLLPDENDRSTALHEIRSTAAEIRLAFDASGALASLDAVLAEPRDRLFAPLLRLQRGRALRALGDPVAAETEVGEALDEIDRQRGAVAQGGQRVAYFERMRQAFDDMVDLRILNGHGAEAALDAAERGRARFLADRIAELPASIDQEPLARSARPAPVAELRRRLPAGVAALEFLVQENRTLVWVVRRSGVEMEISTLGRREIERRVTSWRSAIGAGDDSEARRISYRLHRDLYAQAERHLNPDDVLVFIPDGALHAFPFDALFDMASGRYLIQDRVTFVAPSLHVLVSCFDRARQWRGAEAEILTIAEPEHDPGVFPKLDSLRHARREAQEISELYGAATVLPGAEATRSAVLREAPRHGIVHFAGHALLHPADPFRSTLALAPDPADGHSGALYVREMLGTGLWQTRLAVLSACSTAAGPVWRTEGVISLSTPFLAAGVPTVVASLWKVGDRATHPLMVAFHRHLRQGSDPATALRAAKLEMMASRDSLLRSPRTWAAFEAIGAGIWR